MEHFIEIKALRNVPASLINLRHVIAITQKTVTSPDSAIPDTVTQIVLNHGGYFMDYSRDYSEWVFMLTGRSAPYGSTHPE